MAGLVRDSTGAPVASVSVTVERLDTMPALTRSVTTNDEGRFLVGGLTAGDWRLGVTRIGYRDTTVVVALRTGERRVLTIVLLESPVNIDPVTVQVDRARERFEEDAGITARVITADQLASLPGLAEPDVMAAIEVLPGVVSTSDFSSAFNVRGGSADQNLILLDGIPIFNPFHLGGLFSVFNSDMVARAELLAGGFPAEYGGRVSSVLNVESDGGTDRLDVDGGVSLLASRVAIGNDLPARLRSPVGARAGRWRIAARRSYFDHLMRPFFDFPYHLTDLQGYLDLKGADGDRFTVTAYTGTDLLDLRRLEDDSFPLRIRWDWGNDLIGARWVHAAADGVELDTRLSHTRFGTGLRFPDFGDTDFHSRIAQTSARADLRLERASGPGGAVGGAVDRIGYENFAGSGGTVFREEGSHGWLSAVYGQLDLRTGPWLMQGGVRAEHWAVERERDFTHLAPRFALKRFLGSDVAAKLAAGRYVQYVHSVRNEELPFGLDIWVTAGDRAPTVVSDQVQAGLESFFADDVWFVSLEGYHRRFDGLIAFNFADDPNISSDDFARGSGRAHGADLLVRRDGARGLNGWLAVSWLRARRSLADATIPGEPGEPAPRVDYPPVWDRRLDVDLVVSQRFGAGWEGGARFSFGSGLPYTRALGGFAYLDIALTGGLQQPQLPDDADAEPPRAVLLAPRNSARYPAYHRLDASLRRTIDRSWGTLTPYVQVLNLYNRRNVLFYFYEMDREPPTRTGLSMLPVLPTLGIELSF